MRLAGWSHFAQFTIAVVNKDPKKSKYSGEVAKHAKYTRVVKVLRIVKVLSPLSQSELLLSVPSLCRHAAQILQEGA